MKTLNFVCNKIKPLHFKCKITKFRLENLNLDNCHVSYDVDIILRQCSVTMLI